MGQGITTHHALRRATRHDEADRLALDYIVGPMKVAGFYGVFLNDWLPRICEIDNEPPAYFNSSQAVTACTAKWFALVAAENENNIEYTNNKTSHKYPAKPSP